VHHEQKGLEQKATFVAKLTSQHNGSHPTNLSDGGHRKWNAIGSYFFVLSVG